MKVQVTIINNEGVVLQQTVNGHKKADKLIKDNMPVMTMTRRVKEGWHVYRSY